MNDKKIPDDLVGIIIYLTFIVFFICFCISMHVSSSTYDGWLLCGDIREFDAESYMVE